MRPIECIPPESKVIPEVERVSGGWSYIPPALSPELDADWPKLSEPAHARIGRALAASVRRADEQRRKAAALHGAPAQPRYGNYRSSWREALADEPAPEELARKN